MAGGARKTNLSVALIHAPVSLNQAKKRDPSSVIKMCDPVTGGPVRQVYLNADGEEFSKGDLGRAVVEGSGKSATYRMIPPAALAAIEGVDRNVNIEIVETR